MTIDQIAEKSDQNPCFFIFRCFQKFFQVLDKQFNNLKNLIKFFINFIKIYYYYYNHNYLSSKIKIPCIDEANKR